MYGNYVANNNALSIIEYLVENCYIDFSTMISESEDVTSFQYCEVCGHHRPDWFKVYCYYRYNNNEKDIGSISSNVSITGSKINRCQVTICTKCLD
jgi:hypothetical protein